MSETSQLMLKRKANVSGNDKVTDSVFRRLTNFLFSTPPIDEELRRCYFLKTRRLAEQKLGKNSIYTSLGELKCVKYTLIKEKKLFSTVWCNELDTPSCLLK